MDDCALSEVTTLSRPCRSYVAEFDQRPCPYELIRFIALVLAPRLRPKLRSTDTTITVECVVIAICLAGAALCCRRHGACIWRRFRWQGRGRGGFWFQ